MILVTGASGTVGSAVLQAVQQRGLAVKAMYRTSEDAGRVPAGVETVVADFAQRGSLLPALAGVDSVFLVCSPIPQLVELESNVIAACQQSGVGHVVLNSALGAGDYNKSFPSWHRRVEDVLSRSGLSHTILRPNGFMENILAYLAPSIRAQGKFYAAMGSARMSLVDVRDIADVAAAALAEPKKHAGQVYELNGPEAVSYGELAERISRVAGRPVAYIDIPEAEQRKSMLALHMPEWQVDALLDLQRYYTTGKGGHVTDVLPRLLGHDARRLDSFLEQHRHVFRAQA